jgi:DNA-binding response OmpR family regulator
MKTLPRKVLIVEDEPLIALDLQLLLEEAGYQVIGPATTVEEAKKLADRHELRAALLDLNLNGELTTAVLNLLLEESVPVVVLSGYASKADELPFSRCPFLQKPYEQEDVLRVLEGVIAHAKQRSSLLPIHPDPSS